jgi:hypothetical protein
MAREELVIVCKKAVVIYVVRLNELKASIQAAYVVRKETKLY